MNHRVELAVKAAFKGSRFAQVDEFYQATNQLLKNSGKLKSMIEAAATALGIEYYVLPKLTGTRFVGHRVRALTRLLDMWPAFKTAFETCLSDPANKNINPKVKGSLEKFCSYQFLCLVCTYLDVLEKITPTSKVFEGEGLLAHEVRPTIDLTLLELKECRDVAGKDEEYVESHLGRFKLQMTEDGEVSLSSEYTMKGESQKNPENRKYVDLSFKGMRDLTDISRKSASSGKKDIIDSLSTLLKECFRDFDTGIYDVMSFFDPNNWSDERDYGNVEVTQFAEHFETTLGAGGFDKAKVLAEWRMLRSYARVWLRNKGTKYPWNNILKTKRTEFPNMCALAEIFITISGSNSTVERAFSTLTSIFSNRRLAMKHRRMESVMIISGNDENWSAVEREDIIKRAVEIYLAKRRKTKIASPPRKVFIIDADVHQENEQRRQEICAVDLDSCDESETEESEFSDEETAD